MDHSRQIRGRFLQQAIKLFQTSVASEIGTAKRDGQMFFLPSPFQFPRSLLVAKIIRDYGSAGLCEAQ